ncbi:MAG: TetR/AcrR family transcriptional regulator [Pseudorhodoplanes sp.]|nr:TetR/AcrR family transcriptional regulator [Pseudorhodoplanes sp.]
MPKPSNRDRIIEAGLKVMFRQGFHGAGVRDIVAAASAPQGSFTNHFASKEAFAVEVLDHYFDYVKGLVSKALDDKTLTPRARLRRYLDIITGKLETARFKRGCLIGDFSLETAQESELLRGRLVAVYKEWITPFAECIEEGQRAGDIPSDFPPRELADFLLSSWQGAILRMKVERSEAPLRRFKTIVFATVFKKENA